jgi:hypothetical protein
VDLGHVYCHGCLGGGAPQPVWAQSWPKLSCTVMQTLCNPSCHVSHVMPDSNNIAWGLEEGSTQAHCALTVECSGACIKVQCTPCTHVRCQLMWLQPDA